MTETEHVSLVAAAKRSIKMSFDGFDETDDDIMPELTWRMGYEDGGLGIMVFAADVAENQQLADMMTCHLAVEQAREATFAFTAWTIAKDKRGAWEAEGKPRPAEFSQRGESVLLLHVSPDGEAVHQAEISRYPDRPPTMGDWELTQQMGGHLHDAIVNGVKLGRGVPDDIASSARERMKTQGPDKVLAGLIGVLQEARRLAQAEMAERN